MINSEILITKERVWPVSSDKWKAPSDYSHYLKLDMFPFRVRVIGVLLYVRTEALALLGMVLVPA